MKARRPTQREMAEAGRERQRERFRLQLEEDITYRRRMHLCLLQGLRESMMDRRTERHRLMRGKTMTSFFLTEARASRVRWRLTKLDLRPEQ